MHLAQLNIAKPKYANDDARFAEFMDNLERINGLGESMPGFVWIHKDETGHAMDMPTPWPDAAANLTVWKTPEDFEHFVWNTVHKQFYNKKANWFKEMSSNHFVMWWIEEGHKPTLEEAKSRLDHLDNHGDTDFAFGWSHLPHVKLWQSQRCG
jgi:hypothetical protein